MALDPGPPCVLVLGFAGQIEFPCVSCTHPPCISQIPHPLRPLWAHPALLVGPIVQGSLSE